jgi:hypothetical protein
VELVYANVKHYEANHRYSNPRFFNGQVRMNVSKAIVIGDWPEVVEAYQKHSIPVYQLPAGAKPSEATEEHKLPPLEKSRLVKRINEEGPNVHPAGKAGDGDGGDGDGDLDEDQFAGVAIPSAEDFDALDWSDKRALVKSLGGAVTNKEDAKNFVDEKRAAREASATE